MGDFLLDNLVEKFRIYFCKLEVKKGWDDLKDVFEFFKEFLLIFVFLVMVCVFKFWEIGLKNLCKNE